MDGMCSGGGRQKARLSSPPFPERFYEFLGFDAPHLLQRNQSLGWHGTEVIILGRAFALLLVVPRQRLASQNCLWLTRLPSPLHWAHRDGDRDTNYVLRTPRLTQMRPARSFVPDPSRDMFYSNPSPMQFKVAAFFLHLLSHPAPLVPPLQNLCFVNHGVDLSLWSLASPSVFLTL